MNTKQALKKVSQRLTDLEDTLARAEADIKAYNQCIDGMISGQSPCDWCEDRQECQLESKGKGCDLWMLRYPADPDPAPASAGEPAPDGGGEED